MPEVSCVSPNHPMNPLIRSDLTGNYRITHYKRLFRKPLIVLEVEESTFITSNDPFGITTSRVKIWRPAQVDDLLTLHKIGVERLTI